jgi:hypothetical protein
MDDFPQMIKLQIGGRQLGGRNVDCYWIWEHGKAAPRNGAAPALLEI